MMTLQARDRSVQVKLYKLTTGGYMYKSLNYEANCVSLKELFLIAQQFFHIPLAEVELALLTMEQKDHNVSLFDEPHMIFIGTERADQ